MTPICAQGSELKPELVHSERTSVSRGVPQERPRMAVLPLARPVASAKLTVRLGGGIKPSCKQTTVAALMSNLLLLQTPLHSPLRMTSMRPLYGPGLRRSTKLGSSKGQ